MRTLIYGAIGRTAVFAAALLAFYLGYPVALTFPEPPLPWPKFLNLLGLLGNIIGVTMVALEWRTSMEDGLERVEYDLAKVQFLNGREITHAVSLSPSALKLTEQLPPDAFGLIFTDERMARLVKVLDTIDRLNRRKGIFTAGFLVIVGGSILQLFSACIS